MVRDAIKMASQNMAAAIGQVRASIGTPAVKTPRVLTPGEQLNKFLKLKDQDFLLLRQRVGDKGVDDYVTAMHALAKDYL